MSGLKTAFGIQSSWQPLKQKWEATTSVWNDPVSREFEENFMVPLAAQINQTQNALEELANIIAQAKRNVR
ncbi:MAG: hypothetical protein DRR19_20445 [Candidatus Parabeggiatoa sp. nov. 1]|nr:MAG: hypothetical protein DRR19_20445 [Gammaproteobacteria bacterium]